MDSTMNCAAKLQADWLKNRKSGSDCLNNGVYAHAGKKNTVAEKKGVASALECQELCKKQTTCDYNDLGSVYCKPKEDICTHLMYNTLDKSCHCSKNILLSRPLGRGHIGYQEHHTAKV